MSAHGTRLGDVMPVEIMARRDQWREGVSIFMRQVIVGVSMELAQPVEFKTVDANDHSPVEPVMRLPIHSAQQLMDELWQCGLRPTEGTGSAGSLAATERHLADMRRLVFDEGVAVRP